MNPQQLIRGVLYPPKPVPGFLTPKEKIMFKLGMFLDQWALTLISGAVVVFTLVYILPAVLGGVAALKIITDAFP
jgi:hypothetical protein